MSDRRAWVKLGNCRATDPATMQPEVATPDEVETAKAVCHGCPVFDQCRTEARADSGAYGVWAGDWYGQPPRDPSRRPCQWCAGDLPEDAGPAARYCGDACRQAASRARRDAAALSA